jgi:hypothetical protein
MLRRSEDERLSALGVAYVGSDAGRLRGTSTDKRRHRGLAIFGSLIFPGIGQLVNEEYIKGVVLMALTLVSLGLYTVSPDVGSLQQHLRIDLASASGSTTAVPEVPRFSWLFWVTSVLMTGVWLYALIDAASNASRPAQKPKTGAGVGKS